MPLIDRVKWDDAAPDVFAWRFPGEDDLSTLTQLIVSETQEAYVVKSGVYQGPFLAGRHTLSTENIPLLTSLIKAPFGGQTPFSAEVWFVNKLTKLDATWGTREAIQLQDPKFGIVVSVRSFGQYGIQISDSKRFLLKFVGTVASFDSQSLARYFRGVINTKIKTAIATAIIKNGKSVLDISTELDGISLAAREVLTPEFEAYGVTLNQFNVMSVNFPEDDPGVVTLKNALAKRTEMALLGFTYQQERSYDVMQTAAGNEGNAGGVMGAGLGLGLGVGIGGGMGQAMTDITSKIKLGGDDSVGGAGMSPGPIKNSPSSPGGGAPFRCDKCGHSISPDSKFCLNCGDPVNPCGICGVDNNSGSTVCRSCGNRLPQSCVKCSNAVAPDARFCGVCGSKQFLVCESCGKDLSMSSKFCVECGAAVKSSDG